MLSVLHRKTKRAWSPESGFTLVELLTALVIIGVLLAIAVPSYLGFRQRAADRAAKADIRAAAPAMEAYFQDNIGSKDDADGKKNTTGYKGATVKILTAGYDAGLAPELTIVAGKTNEVGYCLAIGKGKTAWSAMGPGIGDDSYVRNAKCK